MWEVSQKDDGDVDSQPLMNKFTLDILGLQTFVHLYSLTKVNLSSIIILDP